MLESALSFLGLGVQPPTATLGSMLGLGRDYMQTVPWVVASPAILIMLVSLTVMLLGDWLHDHLDVRVSYWAGLENHGTAIFYRKGLRTMVCLIEAACEKVVKLSGTEKRNLEHRLERLAELNWWEIAINPKPALL